MSTDLVAALEPVVAVVNDYRERKMYDDDHMIMGRIPTPKDPTPPCITFGDLRKLAALQQNGSGM